MFFLMVNLITWFKEIPEPWQCYIYQYGIGGLFFLFTAIVAIHGKTVRLNTHSGRVTFSVVVGGFLLAMAVHAIWIYSLLK